ncbi:alpha/beta fold hydrolase [Hutsoniella sourekii]|uniref:alpha/beta fold hydrolase n=1 Tax=Hutsoniella sourekii TaxID=87650 RepID=UPI0004B69C3C|nr:alpha/beta hydrolase [Hutsoniella sourekii]
MTYKRLVTALMLGLSVAGVSSHAGPALAEEMSVEAQGNAVVSEEAAVTSEPTASQAGQESEATGEAMQAPAGAIVTSEQAPSADPVDPEDLAEIKDYGHKLTVKGKQMNVYEAGDKSKPTLLFMPGMSEYSQVLTHKNLIDRLAKKYHVVVVEPFGYGLSDMTDEPRTTENIVSELNESIEQLGLDKVTLVAHSMSGIYAAQYAKYHPEKVAGVIGIDSSTPMMNGGQEVTFMAAGSEDIRSELQYLPTIPDVDADVNEQYKALAYILAGNSTVTDEIQRSNQNLKDAESLKIPKQVPAMYLLAEDSARDMEMRREGIPQITESWEDQHKSLSEDPENVQVHTLEGDHLLYLTQYEEMARLIDEFVQAHVTA